MKTYAAMATILLAALAIPCPATVTHIYAPVVYSGDGNDTTFTFDFDINTTSELVVTVLDDGGVPTVQVENSAYTVAATNNDYRASPGGTVTFTAAPASGTTVVLSRDVSPTQDRSSSVLTRAVNIRDALDKLTLGWQDLRQSLGLSLRMNVGVYGADMNLPAGWQLTAGYPYWDTAGWSIATPTATDLSVSGAWEDIVDGTNSSLANARAVRTQLGRMVYHVKTDYGATGDGTTDDTAAIQAAIDAASTATNPGAVFLPDGDYLISDSLLIYDGISFGGNPSAGSRWNYAGAEHKGVRIIWGGSDLVPAIFLGHSASSTGVYLEGVYLHDFVLLPDAVSGAAGGATGTTTDGLYGLVINGSGAGTLPYASRYPALDLLIERVSIRNFGTNNIRLEGNVFDVRFCDCSWQASGGDGFETVLITSVGSDNPGQIYLTNCYGSSTAEDTWALDWDKCTTSTMIGGGIAGTGDGVTLGSYNTLSGGTNFEGTPGATAKIGVRIMGQGVYIGPGRILDWITGIQIGNSSTENCGCWVYAGTTLRAITNGLLVTAGGSRLGTFYNPTWATTVGTNNIVDTRQVTDGTADVSYRGAYEERMVTFTSDATPDVFMRDRIALAGTATVTDFDNANEGQLLTVMLASTGIDFTHNASVLALRGGVDWTTGTTGDCITFYSRSGAWREVSRSTYDGVVSIKNGSTSAGYIDLYEDTDVDATAYIRESIAHVDLTNAQIKDLADTAVQLVAAPGTGKWLEFCGASLWLDYGTNGLTEPSTPDDLRIEYDSGTGPAASATITANGFITATADTGAFALPASVAGVAATSVVNKNLALVNLSNDYTGNAANDTVIRVIVRYRVHTALGL